MAKIKDDETVFAIDPGNFATAYCVLRGDKKIEDFGKVDNEEFERRFEGLVNRAHIITCEMICSYGMAVGASVFETCVKIGEFKQRATTAGVRSIPFLLVPRIEVKRAICHAPNANDSNIRAALIDSFGAPGKKSSPGPTYGISNDVWAALALAETVRLGEFKKYVWSHERK